jgi:hypothetical protein
MTPASHDIRFIQYRGAPPSEKNLAAGLGENFSLDVPFHRTASRDNSNTARKMLDVPDDERQDNNGHEIVMN